MYGKCIKQNNLIKFFKMMPSLDLNLMYIKVVKLDELYLFIEQSIHIYALVLSKLENKIFYYRTCIEIYIKCMGSV